MFQKFLLKFLNKIRQKKKIIFAVVIFFIVLVGIFSAFAVLAQETSPEANAPKPEAKPEGPNALARAVGWLVEILVNFFGSILLLEVKALIRFAQYNNFVNSQAVINGWVIVRDLCNMFFIVVLLVISIATILKIETYHYKRLLGRLIIMAILINFSKTICGLIIDFTQVLTLTFVNGFSAAAGGNFVEALQLNKLMQIAPSETGVDDWKIVAGYLLALVMVIISCVVVLVMIVVFVMRIIMLWVLIVLSPLAYLLTTFPQGQKYAGQWWSQFGNYVIVGPVMAFFLWLSLISVAKVDSDMPPGGGEETERMQAVITEAGSEDNIIKFIIAIGMLVGGLTITQQIASQSGTMAIGAVNWAQRKGVAPFRYISRRAETATKRASERVAGFISAKTGGLIELRASEREKRRIERHAAIMRRREAERQIRGAAMAERAPLLAAILNPRAVPEVGRLTMIGAQFGAREAREKLRMATEGRRRAGYTALGSIDQLAAFDREQKTEGAINRKRARQLEKEANKLEKKITEEKETKDLLKKRDDSAAKISDYEKQIKEREEKLSKLEKYNSMVSREKEINKEIKVLNEDLTKAPEWKKPEIMEKIKGKTRDRDELSRERSKLEAELRISPDPVVINRQIKLVSEEKMELEEKLSAEKRHKESHEKIVKERFRPVERIREEAEKYRQAAQKNEENLKLDVTMKLQRIKERLAEEKQNVLLRMWKFIQEEGAKRGKNPAEMLAEFEKTAGAQMEAAAKAAEKSSKT
jgi:hypothetical protein